MSLHGTEATLYIALANPAKEERNDSMISLQRSSNSLSSSILSRLHLDFSTETQLYLRFYAFFITEAGFIILAAICLARPVLLNIPFNLTDAEIKGGFTVVFVIWQNLAIFMGSYMVVDAFSREWSVRVAEKVAPRAHDGSPAIVPGAIDRVSTITSGFFNRSRHLLDAKSSGTFKLAFLTSLAFLALGPLGSGTINVATTVSTSIQVGRLLNQSKENNIQEVFNAQGRANLIVRLEKVEHSPYGYKLPPNMFAPVPKVDLASFSGTIEYDSDIIEFHHDCHWEAPQFFNVTGSIIVASAGQQWAGATVGTGQVTIGSSVGSLSLTSFAIEEQVGSSAYIFSGGNSSVLDRRSNPPVPYAVDLTSLPTTFTAEGSGLDLGSNSLYAPLSSVLICAPRPQITGGRIGITSDGTLTVLSFGKKPIGNVPQGAVNLIFANALQVATFAVEMFQTANAVNNIVSMMFMANSSAVDWDTAQSIHPLDLPSINQNMDTFMLSAAKAYIDGYRKNGTSLAVEFELETITALVPEHRLALVTSKPFFIVITVLVAITTLLLLALCRSALVPDRRPFDLDHVFEVLKRDEGSGALVLAARDRDSKEH